MEKRKHIQQWNEAYHVLSKRSRRLKGRVVKSRLQHRLLLKLKKEKIRLSFNSINRVNYNVFLVNRDYFDNKQQQFLQFDFRNRFQERQ